jgi:hypothetical protein
MGAPRSAVICTALSATALLAAAGIASASAAPAEASSTRVVLRLSEDERSGAAPISGTFTASGGLVDQGTATGTHFPVYGKVNGKQDVVGIDLEQHQKGGRGSFVLRCRDSHFVFNKAGNQIVKATGRCVLASPTGAYAHVLPAGQSVLTPSHPRKGFTHTVRVVTLKTAGA